MKNSKKFKMKKLMLFAVAPLAVCGVGGIATGIAIAVTNHNPAEKTDIKTVFSKLTSVWQTNVSVGADPAMTPENCLGGTVFQGEGLREGAKNVVWNKDGLLYYLQQQINVVDENNHSMVNELTVTFQNNYDKSDAYNKWQEVTLSAMQHSTNYIGSVKFYFYLDKTDQVRTLSEDFTNTNIDMTTGEYANDIAPTNAQILKAIKDRNVNLNTNSIHIQYCLNTSEASPTWTNWAEFDQASGSYKTAKQAGVNSPDATIAEQWKSLWNTNGYYGRKANETTLTYALRLIPNPEFSVYSQEPNGIEFTIMFARPYVYDDEDWQSGENNWSYSNSHQYIVEPDTGNFKTTFTQYYNDLENYPFFEKLNTITDSWYFKKTTKDNKFYAQIVMNQSNPYYASLSESLDTSNTKLLFEYTLLSKIDFKSTYQNLVPEGGLEFYTDPSTADIINFFEYKISQQTELSPIFWQEVTIAIDTANKKVTLSVPNSLHYEGDPLEISYKLN